MNLTTFTLSVIVTLLCTLSAYAQRYTTTCLSGTHVRGLNLGGDTLVVFGSYGIIVRSDNGGDTWQQIPGISPAYYLNMPSFNGDTVVVTTDSSVVLVSMDRGRTWREQRFDSLPPLFLSITHRQGSEYLVVMGGAENYGSIYAIDIVTGASRKLWHNPTYSNGAVQQISDSLYCAAFSDGIYTSNDGGLTWIPSKSSVIINQFVPFHIKQLRNGTLAVCYQSLNAQFNRMAYSNDSGTTWAVTDLLPAGGSSWLNDSTVVFAGNFTEVYKVVHPLSSSPVITKLNFDVERMGWFSLSFTTIPLTTGEVIVTGTFRTLYRSDSNCTKLRLLSYMRTDNFVVDALDDDNIVSASTRQQFSVSSNGGSTWMPALLPNGLSYSVQSNAVRYFAKNFIVVNTAIQNLFVSTDGGQTYGLRPQNVALGDGGDRAIIASANRIYSTDHSTSTRPLITYFTDSARTSRQIDYFRKLPTLIDSVSYNYTLGNLIHIGDTTLLVSCMVREYDLRKKQDTTLLYLLRTTDHFLTVDTVLTPITSTYGMFLRGRGDTLYFSQSGTSAFVPMQYISTDLGKTWLFYKKGDTAGYYQLERPVPDYFGDIEAVSKPGVIRMRKNDSSPWIDIRPIPGRNDVYCPIVSIPSHKRFYAYAYMNKRKELFRFDVVDSVTTTVESAVESDPNELLWVHKAHPVPFQNTVQFDIGHTVNMDGGTISVRVFNIHGEQVADLTPLYRATYSGAITRLTWNTPDLAAGVYLVVVNNGRRTFATKLLKAAQ